MKKTLSIILTLVITFSLTLSTFASGQECNCGTSPVIFVHGFGSYPLYIDPESDNPDTAFPPNTKAIMSSIPDIIKVINTLLITKNYSRCADGLIDILEKMMGSLACDENGNSLYNVGPEIHKLPTVDKHRGHNYNFDTQLDGHENYDQYDYYYDFRLDPIDNAKGLADYIKHIKKLTNHSKVMLVCHSQGNTIVSAYLAQYGAGNVEKTVFLSPAYLGLSLIGNMFTENVSLQGKSDAFTLYFKGLLGNDPAGKLAGVIISALNDYGVMPYLINALADLFDAEFDRVFNTALLRVFGTMPGIWSFCPDEYYKEAKSNVFGDSDKYAGLIKKIDNYHYNVQTKLVSTLNSAKNQGMKFAITAGYNIPSIPLAKGDEVQSDMLIDTEYMSIGATGAKPGCTFEEGYKQAKYKNGKNYVSPDNIIDASTCVYPDRTWFFKDQGHDKFTDGYTAFVTDLLLFKGQPTIENMKSYTQFMTNDSKGNLVSITGPDIGKDDSNLKIIIDSLGELILGGIKK